ncbi:unnamed protein product (macronuclear) [Paramecium tetraurelia]|uniref:Uncharacterized protein n=1 Tax=Paramecium tetraurelia TaxID=5888 RepID=A0ECN9_PARTE|nr:uncharacterized protein GSPATT00003925001 [Paramecium tetraurelia]CAK93056.1 unnamed protein product [Paramecium tetraurelia]|eukprot:XP_001460453.1 hypothetical protein (macronuclear) [Paramecium tetraurelia strain d4-2]
MTLNIFIFFLFSLASTQEQWDIIYKSFQDSNTMDASGWIVLNNFNGILFSTCNGTRLFGGYNSFGPNTTVSKHFSLPPHYQINVTFEFWKIDSWNAEYVYFFADDVSRQKQFLYDDGTQLCGSNQINRNEIGVPVTIIMNHISESLFLIMTTNLDETAHSESWAFRDFTLSIVRCPLGCLFCSDNDYNNCYQWTGILSLWHESILLDGWLKNDNIQPSTYKCVSFDLVGGYLNLAPSDKLEKIIQNLIFHYQIQISVQLWKIDTWNNENFELLVDDQIQKQIVLGTTGSYSICGSTGLESIFNIAVTLPHSSSSCKITMQTNHNVATTDAYWGIRAFNIYIAQNCYYGCKQCLGPLKTDCSVCIREWVFYNSLCIYPSPMLGITIRITQIKDPKSHERIPMEINLLETNQQVVTQGTFTYTIDKNLQILNIRVYAKCYPNKKMLSYFIKCIECQSQNQYQFQHYCYGAINSIIYNARFQQKTVSEQQLIINSSDTECSIYQVVNVGNEQLQIKLLQILQQNV